MKIGISKAVLKEFGGSLSCLYDSDKWEFGRKWKNLRSWKNHRSSKWKKPATTFKGVVPEEVELEA